MIHIYTDGSCLGNPGPGGWGVLIKQKGKTDIELSGSLPDTTNNRMELTAAIEALQWLSQQKDIVKAEIFTDSNYVKNGITQWIDSWKKNYWVNSKREPVKNKDLWVRLDSLNSTCQISWNWVKAHNGQRENEYVDQLAYNSAQKALKQV